MRIAPLKLEVLTLKQAPTEAPRREGCDKLRSDCQGQFSSSPAAPDIFSNPLLDMCGAPPPGGRVELAPGGGGAHGRGGRHHDRLQHRALDQRGPSEVKEGLWEGARGGRWLVGWLVLVGWFCGWLVGWLVVGWWLVQGKVAPSWNSWSLAQRAHGVFTVSHFGSWGYSSTGLALG